MEVGVGRPGAPSPATVWGLATLELPVTTVSHFVSLSLSSLLFQSQKEEKKEHDR